MPARGAPSLDWVAAGGQRQQRKRLTLSLTYAADLLHHGCNQDPRQNEGGGEGMAKAVVRAHLSGAAAATACSAEQVDRDAMVDDQCAAALIRLITGFVTAKYGVS